MIERIRVLVARKRGPKKVILRCVHPVGGPKELLRTPLQQANKLFQ